jgi:nucleoside-diphosphate-sugar epimerase
LSAPEFDGIKLTGITKTTTNHNAIREKVGMDSEDRFQLLTTDECEGTETKFKHIVFCAPPSGSEDYPADVRKSADTLWAGPEEGGVFVFTSSGAVYGPGDSRTVSETSDIADPESSVRVGRLVKAEKAALDAGGCVLRLAGLYNLDRGAHNFWLTSGKPISGLPEGIINLLHYEDAASACLSALKAGSSVCEGRAFIISDGHPLTRKQICESALQAKTYKDCAMPTFASENLNGMALGKVYDGSSSNKALEWSPRFESFDTFMNSMA